MPRVAVTGAEGQLGHELCRQLGRDAVPLDLPAFDLTDARRVRRVLAEIRLDAVIHAAAYTHVDQAEQDRERCWTVNSEGARHVAEFCRDEDRLLVQVSTDYVFGDRSDRGPPFREDDAPDPLSVYGASKLAGESWARGCRRHFVVRTCGLFGHAPRARNFVTAMLQLSQRPEALVRVVNDQRCSPSYTPHVARAILFLLDRSEFGTYHVVNAGSATWYEFAREIFRLAGRNVRMGPISTEQYGARAARPRYSVLDTQKFQSLGGPPLPDWREALGDYMQPQQRVGSRPPLAEARSSN